MKRKILISLFSLLVILVTAFIFYNSTKGTEASYKDSDSVTEIVKPMISKDIAQDKKTLDFIVRKGAHGAEFALLGITVFSLSIILWESFKKPFFGTSLFYVLAVAVADEYIQSFKNRSNEVLDIVIDFTGGVLGILVTLIVYFVYRFLKKRIKRPVV